MFPLALVPNAVGGSLHLRRRCFYRGYLLAIYMGPRSPEIYSKCKKLLHHITVLHHVTRMHHFSWVGSAATVVWTKFTRQISRYRKFPGGPMPTCTCREIEMHAHLLAYLQVCNELWQQTMFQLKWRLLADIFPLNSPFNMSIIIIITLSFLDEDTIRCVFNKRFSNSGPANINNKNFLHPFANQAIKISKLQFKNRLNQSSRCVEREKRKSVNIHIVEHIKEHLFLGSKIWRVRLEEQYNKKE